MPVSAAVASDQAPTLATHDLVTSLPAPLLRLLIIFARPLAGLRLAIEVICWKSDRRVQSWMVVGAWWGMCLGSRYVFRWLLPLLLFLPLLPLSRLRIGGPKAHKNSSTDPSDPATHADLLGSLSDLHSINTLLPPSPIPTMSNLYSRFSQLGPRRLLRGLVVIWSLWILIGRFLGSGPLLAMLGTFLLLLPSPTLAHILKLLSRSLAMRRFAALIFVMVFGSPPEVAHPYGLYFSPVGWLKTKWSVSRRPSFAFSFRTKVNGKVEALNESAIVDDDDDHDADNSSEPIYYRFEIHENQRWWMGLDWTAALLPQERPSWCDSHIQSVSSPSAFGLPPSSSIILPAEPGKLAGRVKRTATWKWLDEEWLIVRAGAGATNPSPAAVPTSPALVDDETAPPKPNAKRNSFTGLSTSPSNNSVLEESMAGKAQSIAEQAFAKGLERLKARTTSPAVNTPGSPSKGVGQTIANAGRTSGEFQRGRKGSQASEDARDLEVNAGPAPMETIVEKDNATDADGWVYGDNKWEGMGPKGGLGKFTRRRRWQRRAMLIESIQHLPPGPLDDTSYSLFKAAPAPTVSSDARVRPEISQVHSMDHPPTPIQEADEDVDSLEESRGRSRTSIETASGRMTLEPAVESNGMVGGSSTQTQSRDDALRLRLKKAMGNMGA